MKRKKINLMGCYALSYLTLVACTTVPDNQAESSDPIFKALQISAVKIQSQVLQINQQSQAKYGQVKPGDVTDQKLLKVISPMKYSGYAEKLLFQVSQDIGYEFKIIGKKIGASPVVSVDFESIEVFELLVDIGVQIDKSQLLVDQNKKTIELTY